MAPFLALPHAFTNERTERSERRRDHPGRPISGRLQRHLRAVTCRYASRARKVTQLPANHLLNDHKLPDGTLTTNKILLIAPAVFPARSNRGPVNERSGTLACEPNLRARCWKARVLCWPKKHHVWCVESLVNLPILLGLFERHLDLNWLRPSININQIRIRGT